MVTGLNIELGLTFIGVDIVRLLGGDLPDHLFAFVLFKLGAVIFELLFCLLFLADAAYPWVLVLVKQFF